MGKPQEAIRHYEQSVQLKPDYADAHYNWGAALRRTGKPQQAIEQFQQALRTTPDDAETHNELALALSDGGKLNEAVGHWEQAIQLRPEYAEAQYNLGVALWQTGKSQEAIRHWEQAVRIRPDYAEAKNKLAWLLATIAPTEGSDPLRAVSLAEGACQLTENRVPTYLDTLAVAYAAAGRFNDAIATAGKAIEVARAAGQQQEVSQLEIRLQLYRSGRPYRLPPSGTRPSEP
jgi:tetratricopeptide (TPR) repeat protein